MRYDVLVLGGGLAGSVTALRLAEKGYRVGVLEAGEARRSLRSTARMPPQEFFTDPQWAHITDWKAELKPCFDRALRMVGRYRPLAEQSGVRVHPERTVTDLRPRGEGYAILSVRAGLRHDPRQIFEADHVVFAQGAAGTRRLLSRLRDQGSLTRLSGRLGQVVRPQRPVPGLVGRLLTKPYAVGGCVIGASSSTGVIDPYHRVYGHPGLHVMDGSAITADTVVDPALTIAAQAERALEMWPYRDEPDARPALGARYVRLDRAMAASGG